MKVVQYFTQEYLEQCKKMKPKDILRFLEDYRCLNAQPSKTKLISLKVEENMLNAFKQKAEISNIKYQTQIKKLMYEWLKNF